MKKKNRKKMVALLKNQPNHLVWKKTPTIITNEKIISRITLANGDLIEIRLVKGKRVFRITKNDGHLTQSQYQNIQNQKIKETNLKSKRRANSLWTPFFQGGIPGLKK